jgi:anti-anti-sigma factor
MTQTLTCATRHEGAVATVAVAGELDMSTVPELQGALAEALAGGPDLVVLDLRELRFLDSSGLRAVLAADRTARTNGHDFAVIRGPRSVHQVFEITGMDKRLAIVAGEDGLPRQDGAA